MHKDEEARNRYKSENNGNLEMSRESKREDGGGGGHKGTWYQLAVIGAIMIPILFPLIHMLIFSYLWSDLTNPVDRKSCSCSCWDTVFKRPYEMGIAKYKHVYFNCTWNTFKMWASTVVGVVVLYECFKTMFRLLIINKLRFSMAILFVSSLHSHYNAWWGHWNYWNDDFYELWYHQIFYTVSELVSSTLVVCYLDRRKSIHPLPILAILNIAVFHILSSGWDQFFFTVIQRQGYKHQVLRDLILMFTDIIHATLTSYELNKYARQKGHTFTALVAQKKNIAISCTIMTMMYLIVSMFP